MKLGKKGVNIADVVKSTADAIATLEKDADVKGKAYDKALDEVAKHLGSMKEILYGTQDRAADEDNANKLCDQMIADNVACSLIKNLPKYHFETKKDVSSVVTNLLRKKTENSEGKDVYRFCDHLLQYPAILDTLILGYEQAEIALASGAILRECLRYEPLAGTVLQSDNVWRFFHYVEVSNFDVSSDALTTFRELLTRHRSLVAAFLVANYDKFFANYNNLLKSTNYVTRRQSLKLLGEIIVHRSNFNVMSKYIASKHDLMMMMNLLRDKSKSIQYEAFHVFKVFVANPNKPPDVLDILVRNRDRLIQFLKRFRNEIDDEQFNREKAYLIKEIEGMSQQ